MIGTRKSFCVWKIEGHFVVEHEVMRTRDKKKIKERRIINKSRDRGRSDAATCLVLSVAVWVSLQQKISFSSQSPYNDTLALTNDANGHTSLGSFARTPYVPQT